MTQKLAHRQKPRDPTDVLVGKRLHYARQLTGTSQAALARILGVSPRMVKEYENGHRRLGPVHLAAAATAIEVSLAFFFEEDLPVLTCAAGDPTVLTPKEAHIIRQFRTLPKAQQDEIFELVQYMVQPDGLAD